MSVLEALEAAQAKGLDLVEVGGGSSPSVCRIMDYGKHKYQASKRLHDAKKKQKIVQIKEIKMRPKTEEHDFEFKRKNAEKFLLSGFKVKVILLFRGREIAFQSLGMDLLDRFAAELEEFGELEQKPKLVGKSASMVLVSKKESKGKS